MTTVLHSVDLEDDIAAILGMAHQSLFSPVCRYAERYTVQRNHEHNHDDEYVRIGLWWVFRMTQSEELKMTLGIMKDI